MEYDKKGDTNGFVKLLENARKHATVNYQNNEKDQVQVRKMLVKCYAGKAFLFRNKKHKL